MVTLFLDLANHHDQVEKTGFFTPPVHLCPAAGSCSPPWLSHSTDSHILQDFADGGLWLTNGSIVKMMLGVVGVDLLFLGIPRICWRLLVIRLCNDEEKVHNCQKNLLA